MKKKSMVRMSLCLVVSLVIGLISGAGLTRTRRGCAATFDAINQDYVFVKQPAGSNLCTLAAATDLVRRAAMMNGNSSWQTISLDMMRSAAWVEDTGLKWDFNCGGITVTHDSFSGSETELQQKLSEHPEGVVIYKQKSDQQHAILVTDYTGGVFYCADPSNGVAGGRIAISDASIQIADANYLWYVSSPTLYLTTASGGTIDHAVETPKPTVTPKPTATPTVKPTATPKATAKATKKPSEKTKATEKPSEKTKATEKPTEKTKATQAPKKKDASDESSNVTAPKQVTGVKVVNKMKKNLTVTWSQVKNAKGYQIRFGHAKNLKGSAYVNLSGCRAQLTGLSKGSVYYVKVRAYRLKNKKKVFGAYSAVKKGKVKK